MGNTNSCLPLHQVINLCKILPLFFGLLFTNALKHNKSKYFPEYPTFTLVVPGRMYCVTCNEAASQERGGLRIGARVVEGAEAKG